LSIIKHVTLQKIVAHDFQYDPRIKNHRLMERIEGVDQKQWGYEVFIQE
jgi:hypothetical protein